MSFTIIAFSGPGSNLGSLLTLSCHISLVPFKPEQSSAFVFQDVDTFDEHRLVMGRRLLSLGLPDVFS